MRRRSPTFTSLIPIPAIIELVAFEFERDAADILGPLKFRRLTWARAAIAWLARRYTPATLGEIGAALGGRDFSTVGYQVRRAGVLRDTDGFFREMLDRVDSMLVPA